jgi:hypothetical protein
MRTNIRLKLDMAGRAVEFCRAHPDDNPATAQVATRLNELVARANTLAQHQRATLVAGAAAVEQKSELRVAIEQKFSALMGIARVASVQHPDIAVHRRMPQPRTNEATFLTTVRVGVSEAKASKELLVPFGLTDTLLDDITADLDAYEAALGRQRNAHAAQVGAGAELAAVTDDIMGVVKNLDALHRLRFQKDRELHASWMSARNVAWRLPEPEAPASPTPAPAGSAPEVGKAA